MSSRVLLVEDDDAIAPLLDRALAREGYDVHRVATGAAALEAHREAPADLIVLDLGLPDIDGLEVCRQLREWDQTVVVIMLTARADELDRVVGLDMGADDYLAKPFGLAELLARIRAALRRRAPAAEEQIDQTPASIGLRVHKSARRVFVGSEELHLTSKEFDLLDRLSDQAGEVVTRETLMDEVWDENWFGSTKTLDVTLGRLRQKLIQAGADVRIVSVRGVGFRLEPTGSDDA